MRIFLALVLGALIGAAVVWYYHTEQGHANINAAADQVQSAAKSTGQAIEDKLRAFNLRTNDIKDELARGGTVVRQKAQQASKALADATADARTTAAIKAKLFASHDLPAMSISVNTTDGVVTLSGNVHSLQEVSKAMLIAMETEGVRQVISTLQVKPK